MTLFPAPAIQIIFISLSKTNKGANTDVFHESIRASLNLKISTPRTCRLQSTMSPFRDAENQVRGYDSSTGPEVKASSGHLLAPCHL
jgi:hypothetical protein